MNMRPLAVTPIAGVTMFGPAPNRRGNTVLSVIVPTFNERCNIEALVNAIATVLGPMAWEIILVDDDSPDRTWSEAKLLAHSDARIRCIRRIGRRGLAGACIEGILSSSAPYVAVIDGDLQHDERALMPMLDALQKGDIDLAIGTRLDAARPRAMTLWRAKASAIGRSMSRLALHRDVADPMSGFFMVRRDRMEEIAPRLSIEGFKILADILMTADKDLRIVEIPYEFQSRREGVSKFGAVVSLQYVGLLVHKLSGGVLPVRFALFATVGAIGLVIHLLILRLALSAVPGLSFFAAQLIATYAAMTSNFLLNNQITFRESRFRGRHAAGAFVAFCLVCSIGTLANADLASRLFRTLGTWWMAGTAGAVVSSVWNYAMSRSFVWSRRT